MKKNLLIAALFFIVGVANAKKVKFSVDMTGQTISSNGIHLSGDMQDEAGFPADWEPNTTQLTKEGTSNIYSVVLDIPAFRKYEYKFVNGDLFYEVEFVPEESRVTYDFNDNRWIYIDSLSNDITELATLLFGGNAPLGKKLVHFKVNLKGESTISSNGVHLASSINNWNYGNVRLYSFYGNVFEDHGYVDSNTTVSYQFVNGNTLANAETVPTNCASSGNRTVMVNSDVALNSICFSTCTVCEETAGINSASNFEPELLVFPNPAKSQFEVQLNAGINQINIIDVTGKIVKNINYNTIQNNVLVNAVDLESGFYFVTITSGSQVISRKIAIQN